MLKLKKEAKPEKPVKLSESMKKTAKIIEKRQTESGKAANLQISDSESAIESVSEDDGEESVFYNEK